jgi:electron-transferring-flavoprotein dehydrogenase
MENSWVWQELHSARNIKNTFKNGLYSGLAYGGVYRFLNGKEPFDIRNKSKDSELTKTADNFKVTFLLNVSP